MRPYPLSVDSSRKTILTSLAIIPMVLMLFVAMLPLSSANEDAPTIKALGAETIPTIDAKWTTGEWDDTAQYNITGSGGTGYIRMKHNSTHLYVMIDSVWDLDFKSTWGSYEGTYIAFDTLHNHGTTPQTDDYLFFNAYSTWMNSWKGDGSKWAITGGTGFVGEQALGSSPNSATLHRIDEMAVPFAYVGSIGSTSGLYIIVRDDSSWNGTAYTSYVEWPESAGGNSNGWPMSPSYVDPCPAPTLWGHLNILQRPTAAFTWNPTYPYVNDLVEFDATTSNDDGSIVNYAWDFDDGNVTAVSTPVIIHAFSETGTYSVNLTITDDDGLVDSKVHTVSVGIVASFTFLPSIPDPGDAVTFDASASLSLGGTIVNYAWDFGDGNTTTTTDPIIIHVFTSGGTFEVNLTVTDDLSREEWVVHKVDVGVPVARFSFWPPKPNAQDGTIFNATDSFDPDGIASYAWTWGDSGTDTTTEEKIVHTFLAAGTYSVNLTVTDNTGLRSSVVQALQVYGRREARFSFSPSAPKVGDSVSFDASLSTDPSGNIASYKWNFDDDNTTSTDLATIRHEFLSEGSFNVNLTIFDNDGLTSSQVQIVQVATTPATAHLLASFSAITPNVDGVWTQDEWADAVQYNVTGSGGTSYLRMKHDNTRLFIIIDSVWDTTLKARFGSYEGTYFAFDSAHDSSTIAPQTDDYLFFNGYSAWLNAWQGNGTRWTDLSGSGFAGQQLLGSSPNGATLHRIDEMSIPLTYVGSINSTVGCYAIVRDDDSWNDITFTAFVEWPSAAGGDSNGWPMDPDYIDPCPAPNRWGELFLEPKKLATSSITLVLNPSSITLGKGLTIDGKVLIGTIAADGVNVSIKQMLSGATDWSEIDTETTDSTGSFSCTWTPTAVGTYKIKAIWTGDADTYGAESEVKTLTVEPEEPQTNPFPLELVIIAIAGLVVILAVVVYLLRSRRRK